MIEELIAKIESAAAALWRLRHGTVAAVSIRLVKDGGTWTVVVGGEAEGVKRTIGGDVAGAFTAEDALRACLETITLNLRSLATSARAVLAQVDDLVKDEAP
jgi:hypothetical protein